MIEQDKIFVELFKTLFFALYVKFIYSTMDLIKLFKTRIGQLY